MRTGDTRRARPVASSTSTASPDSAAGPSAGPKRAEAILVVARLSGSSYSMPMTES